MTTEIQQIPLSAVFESPDNPRKTYSETSLQEMAETIRDHGVQQPIKVRPLPMIEGAEHFTYEIIFGHRRTRAAKLAGLEFIPCIVEEMTDEKADTLRLVENIQREQVNPVEEADALVRLMQKHGIKAEALGKQLGLSRTNVYNKAKLATATEKVREACQAGVIGSEIATAVARYAPAVQPHALKACLMQAPDPTKGPQGTKMVAKSRSDALDSLRRGFTVNLAVSARFPLDQAGITDGTRTFSACSECSSCSDADEGLMADLGPGACADKECFEAKTNAFEVWRISEAKQAGQTVFEGEDALRIMPATWQMLDYTEIDVHAVIHGAPPEGGDKQWFSLDEVATIVGMEAPEVALLVNPHHKGIGKKVIEVVDEAALDRLVEAFMAKQPQPETKGQASDSTNGPQPVAERPVYVPPPPPTPEERAVTSHFTWGRIKLAIMRKAVAAERSADDLRLIIQASIEQCDDIPADVAEVMGWDSDELPTEYGESTTWITARMAEMSADELAKLALLLAIDSGPFPIGDETYTTARLAMAARFGVDVLGVTAEEEATPTAEQAEENLALDLEDDADDDEQDNAPVAPPPAPTAKAGKPVPRYRNPATGETWSGRGLQPKWVQVAVAAGKTLADFDTQAAEATA